jgi:hypothetical protein
MVPMEIELPHDWQRLSKRPFCQEQLITKNYIPKFDQFQVIYGLLFFIRRRSLLIDRNWNLIGTIETRNAKNLYTEALDLGWVKEHREKYKIPFHFQDYPSFCEDVFLIEVMASINAN